MISADYKHVENRVILVSDFLMSFFFLFFPTRCRRVSVYTDKYAYVSRRPCTRVARGEK